jgi:hypothetical protein
MGSSPDGARRNADHAFAGFAFRFFNVQRDAKFTTARPLMARHALVPSRIFGDTAVWSASGPDSVRALHLEGRMAPRGYQFSARTAARYPEQLGDQRHFLQLTRLRTDEYEWITHVDHAIGPVRAPQVGDALGALFTGFERRTGEQLRADIDAHFPRTARQMHQVMRLDSVTTALLPDGSTSFVMRVRITPDSIRRTAPAFAAYLDKYVMPSRLRMRLSDAAGTPFFDLNVDEGTYWVRLRARGGELVALTGPPRPLPDSLRVRLDASARFKIFRVGFTNLVGDFTIERGDHQRGWLMRFRREPEWDFPLAADRLIRTPLRRPFAGRGSELRLAVRDDLGRQALSVRQVRTAVQESAIMRWLGGLGSTAFGDFEGTSEAEENRFLTELFGALRQDVAALSP